MLSAIIIAKNEADNIRRCLKSLQFTDEQIVVDSGSEDETVAIAEQLGARVIHQAWRGYGAQKNAGAAAASGRWLLFIDADEEVTPQLASEIKRTLKASTHQFYWLPIITIFLGRPLNHLSGNNPRLYKAGAGRWTTDFVHEQVETTSGTRLKLGDKLSHVLRTALLHYSHQTIDSYLKRMHRYTTLDAKQMAATGKHRSGRPAAPTVLLPWQLSARQFIKLLVYRRGMLDGYPGLMWCALSAYYEWEMGKKYLKMMKS